MKLLIQLPFLFFVGLANAAPLLGFNVTDVGAPYDYLSATSSQKSFAKNAIDQIHSLGATQVVLNIRAHMHGPRSSDIRLVVPENQQALELKGLCRLIEYAHK